MHCLILRGPAGAVVRRWNPDTRLNGGAFLDAPLKQGDRLGVGPMEFEVLQTGAATPGVSGREGPVAGSQDPGQNPAVVQAPPAGPADSSLHKPSGSSGTHDPLKPDRELLQHERQELDALRRSLESQRAAFAEERRRWEEACQAKERALAERAEQLERRQTEWQSQQNDLETRQAEINKYQTELHRLQSCLEAERTRREAGERIWKERRSELEHRTAELETRLQELDSQQRQLQSLRAELESQHARQQTLEAELRSRLSELEAREARLAAAQRALEEQQRAFEAERKSWAESMGPGPSDVAERLPPDAPTSPTPGRAEPSGSKEPSPIQTIEVLRRLGLPIPAEEDELAQGAPGQQQPGRYGPGELGHRAESSSHQEGRPGRLADHGPLNHDRQTKPTGQQTTVPTSAGVDREEESIDDYMAKLLERMRAGSQTESPRSSPRGTPAQDRLTDRADAGEESRAGVPEAEKRRADRTAERARRTLPPEKTSVIGAMRELANMSAQAAILRHAQGKLAQARTSRLFVALLATAASGLLYWMGVAWDAGDSAFLGALVCSVVAIVWGIQYLVLAGRLIVGRWRLRYRIVPSPRSSLPGQSTPQTSPASPTQEVGAGVSAREPGGAVDRAGEAPITASPSEQGPTR